MGEEAKEYPKGLSAIIVIVVVLLSAFIIVLACVALLFFSSGSYFNEEIKPYEVGVQTQSGMVKAIVGPGTYSDIGWGVGLERISCEAVLFAIEDPEVITKDRQRIAIAISGDILRSCDKEFIEETWLAFRQLYLEDDALLNRTQSLSLQAIKSCVDDYDSDVILEGGNAGLEICIDDQLNALAGGYGFRIENLRIQETAASQ
jgi:hypothetical protein